MVRTQVQFTDNQIKALRQLSAQTGRSVADLTRDAVNHFLSNRPNQTDLLLKRALSVVGAFTSGSHDGSTAHDRHLAETFL
jgi:hypothetical protein